MTGTWVNWGRNQQCHPAEVARPRTTGDLVDLVARARGAGLRVKAAGAGHSFTGIGLTDGVLTAFDGLAGVVAVDEATGRVTVQAGMPLHALNALLARHGLALPNLGDIDRQTLAGAISTGTHGTGARKQGIAAAVVGLEMVLADGTVATCSASASPELFAAARVGLGALGLLSSVTLQCVPAFTLLARERPDHLDAVLDGFDEWVDTHDHAELFWFPHTDRVLTKSNDRLPEDEPRRPLARARRWLDDELLSNTFFEGANRLTSLVPALVRPLAQVSARALAARTYTAPSQEVFVSPRRVRFVEMEYCVPRSAVTDVVRELRRFVDASGLRVSFPVEVRVCAPDDIWLSTAHERESAYVAVHMFRGLDPTEYFRGFEAIATAAGGRPHWGKVHHLDAPALRERYPRFDDFVALRDTLDPGGMFSNPYLDRCLGPAPGDRR